MKNFFKHLMRFFRVYATNMLMFLIGASLYITGMAMNGRMVPWRINPLLFVVFSAVFSIVQYIVRILSDALEAKRANLSVYNHPVL
jgi:hypothetical protein